MFGRTRCVCTDGHRVGPQDIRSALPDFDAGVSKKRPQGRSRRIGSFVGGAGLGAMVAGLMLATLANRVGRQGVLMFVSLVSLGIVMDLFSWTNSFPMAILALIAIGGCQVFYMATTNTMLQVIVPDHSRARDEYLCIGPRFDARGCAYGGSQRPRDRRAGDRKLHGISGYSADDSGGVAGAGGSRYRASSGELTYLFCCLYDRLG